MQGPTNPHTPLLLTQLPDPCLLAVLQHFDDDPASLFSAARAHSTLRNAAAVALSRVTVRLTQQQQQLDSLHLYLSKHGQHVHSLELRGVKRLELGGLVNTVTLRELPPNLQLDSLVCEVRLGDMCHGLGVQLQPGGGAQGVLGVGLPLKQLRLEGCRLLDGSDGLEAALRLLPSLEQLSISDVYIKDSMDKSISPSDLTTWEAWEEPSFNTGAVQQLQQLTFLELRGCMLFGPPNALSFLQPMTQLVDLRLEVESHGGTTASGVLAGLSLLTRLEVWDFEEVAAIDPADLSGKSLLQHLQLQSCDIAHGTAGVAQLLSQLQPLQQLTCLDLANTFDGVRRGSPPAAAFSALTASSKLCHLDLRGCDLPAAAWQHVFPAGRQLLHLTSLGMAHGEASEPDSYAPYRNALNGASPAGCCPNLQCLYMYGLTYGAQLLASLQQLSSLQTLHLSAHRASRVSEAEVCAILGKLTGLRELGVAARHIEPELLEPLTNLRHLTALYFVLGYGHGYGEGEDLQFICEDPDDEPVQRQLLQHLLHI